MNTALRAAYHVAGAVATRASDAAAWIPGDAKWLRALRARHGVIAHFTTFGDAGRDPGRPLLWMHAPSVGEGLQGKPVLEIIRAQRPEYQIAYTHFSPSAEPLAAGFRERGLVDFTAYLPWDTASAARDVLATLRPAALVFVKLDVWPMLTVSAATTGVRLGLVSGTLSEHSGRRSPWGAALLRDAYARLDAAGAISPDDAARLQTLGVPAHALSVTGDTRYDQVWERAAHVRRDGPLLRRLAGDAGHETIVAGSTWPPDEEVVLDAWVAATRRSPGTRLILAPHEPSPDRIAALERWAASHDTRAARLDAATTGGGDLPDLVLVDRVGVLGDLYAIATIAYVGGAFHSAGLHSVLEPAAYGVPVVFGPRYGGQRDAALLLSAGGAVTVRDATTCASAVGGWLTNPASRRAAGEHARAVVESGLGAAQRSAALVERLVDGRVEAPATNTAAGATSAR
jgi:3-deoxy-D-manno-octulosonic-acid transferase